MFAINGLMVAIAGLISARLGAGRPSAGNIAELDAIACVIGGTSGGRDRQRRRGGNGAFIMSAWITA